MKIFKKIALGIALAAGFQVSAGVINLDSLLNGKRDEATVRKAILECIQKYPKVVLYFGTEKCPPCKKMKATILALLSKYPDVMFILVDLEKYPYLKEKSWPKVEFRKASYFLTKTGFLTKEKLEELLNKYYR